MTLPELERGFTLLEVMVAMAGTALVALLAYGGLTAAGNAVERHRGQVTRLAEVSTALGWLVRDLQQALPRSIVDAEGEVQPALSGGMAQPFLLELTSAGWSNHRGARRGMLQRARYRLESDGVLWRDYWPVLDRGSDGAGMQSVLLLRDVDDIELAFLGPSGEVSSPRGDGWSSRWPAAGMEELPWAVRIRADLQGIGRVERIVGLPDAMP